MVQAALLYGDISKAINETPKLLKSASGTPKLPCSEICHSASEIRQMASEIMLTHNEIFANAKVIRNNISVGRGRGSRRFYCKPQAHRCHLRPLLCENYGNRTHLSRNNKSTSLYPTLGLKVLNKLYNR